MSLYDAIGFSEPPFIESGAATNVTPFIPEKLLEHLRATVECALGGQVSPIILGGAAGSGKTTITRYYFNYRMQKDFKSRVAKSIVVNYTITDGNELADVTVFYRNILQSIIKKVSEREANIQEGLEKEIAFEKRLQSKDPRQMLELFKDVNRYLRRGYSPFVYVIDEIDYLVDLINKKDYTFIHHLRHIVDFLSEIRFAVLVLSSTKFPAAFIRAKIRSALAPVEERISENIELTYSEGDFLKFVKTRLTEPIIEETNGTFTERVIRLETRRVLEKEYGAYFPLTEESLIHLYRREKGPGVTVDRLRTLERHLAKLINIYCIKGIASPKGMESGKIFGETDIDRFLTGEEAAEARPAPVQLTPKEEEWFVEFFGFSSDQYKKFSHEKCVKGIAMALSKYLTSRAGPVALPTGEDDIGKHVIETKKGLSFFSYSSTYEASHPYNLGIAVTLLRDSEKDIHGWESLSEVVSSVYELSPRPQKKLVIFFVEDDFEFEDISADLKEHVVSREKETCAREEDIENSTVSSDQLLIKSPNLFRILFVRLSNLIHVLSICAKMSSNDILGVGETHFKAAYDAISEWGQNPLDFHNYAPMTEKVLQSAILLAGIEDKPLTDQSLSKFFNTVKTKRERYSFDELCTNGFLRETEVGIYQICMPPTLAYLFKKHTRFQTEAMTAEFGVRIEREVEEFLKQFLGFRPGDAALEPGRVQLGKATKSAKDTIGEYFKKTKRDDFKELSSLIEKIKNMDFEELDRSLKIHTAAGFGFTETVAQRFVEAMRTHVESAAREFAKGENQEKIDDANVQNGVATEIMGKLPSKEGKSLDDDKFLQFIKAPRTLDQIRMEYSKQALSDEELWVLLRRLYQEERISLKVEKR